MRIPAYLLSARTPQREQNVPFQEMLPLRLKSSVSGKSDSTSDVSCLQEMTVLFSCLKTNEFSEMLCNKEITNFNKCYKVFLDKKKLTKATQNKGILTPGRTLNYRQLNKYLKGYPN